MVERSISFPAAFGSVPCVIEYVVHPPALAPNLAAHLREQGYDVSTSGAQLWATHPTAADPTEERVVLGGVIVAWRREHPDARVDLQSFTEPGIQ